MLTVRPVFASIALACAMTFALPAQHQQGPPTLPPGCEALAVQAGNHVSLHVYAFGVQIYRWNATTNVWDFVAPAAVFFGAEGSASVVGMHYAGPTWQLTTGSKVVGSVLARCSPTPTAVAWLLLSAVAAQTQGPGLLGSTTFVQRVRTTGGLAPARTGVADEMVGVPYTAQYYFYSAN
jgi:Protein of unknown function (DUF3455)